MSQKYLIFCGTNSISIQENAALDSIIVEADGKTKHAERLADIRPYVEMIENGQNRAVVLFVPDAGQALETIKSYYDAFVLAAGGLVTNPAGQLLMIYRNGKWDLPKGKVEEGEIAAGAALREVKEETGLKQLMLLSFFDASYYTYTLNGRRFFKETLWYLMSTTDTQLTPQREEGIEKATWFSPIDLPHIFCDTYHNIELLIRRYLSEKEKLHY